jgi:hypothetical protein
LLDELSGRLPPPASGKKRKNNQGKARGFISPPLRIKSIPPLRQKGSPSPPLHSFLLNRIFWVSSVMGIDSCIIPNIFQKGLAGKTKPWRAKRPKERFLSVNRSSSLPLVA